MIYRHLGVVLCSFVLITCYVAVAYADTSPCPYSWDRTLRQGSNGSDVLALQRFLNEDASTTIALSGPGSPGNETSVYGSLTAKAVTKFQQEYALQTLTPAGLTAGTGVVGPLTRAELNQLCAATLTSTITATSSPPELTVAAATQPAPTLAPAGAGGVPFTSFTLTAGGENVTVDSITIERTGAGEDGAFSDVALTDQNGDQIGNTESFNAVHEVVFDQPFTVSANTSGTFTISGDMAGDLSNFDGQMPALQVDSVSASVLVEGNLPIKGTAQTINNSLVIGSAEASLSAFDPDSPTNRYINESGVIFSGIRITAASQEDLTLSSITWDQTGTAGPEDIADIATVVNGVSYPTTANGSSYTSTFSPGIVIPEGRSVDIYVQGDLTTTGANRTVEFDIDDSSDIGLSGNTYGFGVGVTPENDTAQSGNSVFLTSDGTPEGNEGSSFFAGSVATINPGTALSIEGAN